MLAGEVMKSMTWHVFGGSFVSLALLAACAGGTTTPMPEPTAATPSPTAAPLSPTAEPLSPTAATPAPGVVETPSGPAMQELALLENYAATTFFPDIVFLRVNVPVRLYFSRLHREHVNQFAIEPFFNTSDPVFPGEIAVFEFFPDQVGEFKISNVGHGFEATLFVVEDEQEAASTRAEQGVQQFSLIYGGDPPRVVPEEITVEKGILVKVYILATDGEHHISVLPFYSAASANVGLMEITTFEFTPTDSGIFEILDEISGLKARLIVK